MADWVLLMVEYKQVLMLEIFIGDQVELRKPHPCGSRVWVIRRVGADVRLECAGCGRSLMLPRGLFNKRVRRVVQRANPEATAGERRGTAASATEEQL